MKNVKFEISLILNYVIEHVKTNKFYYLQNVVACFPIEIY